MMAQYSKYVGIAKITDPADVQTQCNTYGIIYKPGSIFCTVPGLGLEGNQYVYCRYGLSFPYFRIQPEWKVLIEPTIMEKSSTVKNWFYTGLVDCGGDSGVTPDTDMQMLLQFVSQVIYASGTTLHLGDQNADEPLVLGDAFITWLTNFVEDIFTEHTHYYSWTGSPGTGYTGAPGDTSVGAAAYPTSDQEVPDDLVSTTVFTE